MLSGALIARTAVQQGGKAALKEIAEEVTDVPTDLSDFTKAAREAGGVEKVQRVMSRAELEATKKTGLLRGGREGTHYVTPATSRYPKRAMQRLALDPKDRPDVRVTMEAPRGKFGPAEKIPPKHGMPGGGKQRTAEGDIPVRIKDVSEMRTKGVD